SHRMGMHRIHVAGRGRHIFLVVLFPAIGINFSCLRRHRRIQNHRQHRYAFLVFKFTNKIENFLGASDRKRGNQDLAVVFSGVFDYALESNFWFLRIVRAIAISRLDYKIFACRRRYRIANDWLVILAEVSGKQYSLYAVIRLNKNKDLTRPENMTGDAKLGADAVHNFERLAVVLYD